MRVKFQVGYIALGTVLANIAVAGIGKPIATPFRVGPPEPLDAYLDCFKETIGLVNETREDHAPTLYSDKNLAVFLPATRDEKSGFYVFTRRTAYFHAIRGPQDRSFELKIADAKPTRFTVDRKVKKFQELRVEQFSNSKEDQKSGEILSEAGVFTSLAGSETVDAKSRAVLGQEIQKRLLSFSGDLDALAAEGESGEPKHLVSSHSFLNGRIHNMAHAADVCGKVTEDGKIVAAARKASTALRAFQKTADSD